MSANRLHDHPFDHPLDEKRMNMSLQYIDDRTPCIIGVAQHTWRPDGTDAPEPLEMWSTIARAAATDAGATADPIRRIDDLNVVHYQSWQYDAPAERLAARLGLAPGRRTESILAGTSPQRLVNAAAERMLRGEIELALVVGGEALATTARLRRNGVTPAWSAPHPNPSAFPLDVDEWFLPTELAHGIIPAWLTFALLEEARRSQRRVDRNEYRQQLGRVLERCNAVAAENPYAWFRYAYSADAIVTPSARNRMVATPYTKRMTAFMDVDMAAGLLLATHATADALGVPSDHRVYLRGWGFARDSAHVAARHDLGRSGAMRAAASAALAGAGVGVDDVAAFDLYGCFSAAIGFATDALGVRADDSRPITLTGALPYHGGPSSNYMSHSIACLVEHLRERPGEFGLVSGVGMHMTKHVYACYSTEPGPVGVPDYVALQASVDAEEPDRRVAAAATGTATIATATTVYDRDSAPSALVAVCDLPDGSRAYARTTDPDVLARATDEDWIGRSVDLHTEPDGTNAVRVADLALR